MSKLGLAAYHYFFRPLNALGYSNLIRQGPVDTFRAYLGRRGLRRWIDQELLTAAPPSLSPYPNPTQIPHLCVAYLAGDSQRDLLFASLTSLYRHWPKLPAIRVLSDGALSTHLASDLERAFPGLVAVREQEQQEWLNQSFPRNRFPVLRGVRDQYLHLRKMLDVFTLKYPWILLLDADTLFHSEPTELLRRLKAGEQALYLLDRRGDSYGYPTSTLQSLIEQPLLERINAGLLALPAGCIDWDRVEFWLAALSEAHGINYFVEQALWALILSSIGAAPLHEYDYVCEPTRQQIRSRTGVFHHYVWPCRHLFYGYAWQQLSRS